MPIRKLKKKINKRNDKKKTLKHSIVKVPQYSSNQLPPNMIPPNMMGGAGLRGALLAKMGMMPAPMFSGGGMILPGQGMNQDPKQMVADLQAQNRAMVQSNKDLHGSLKDNEYNKRLEQLREESHKLKQENLELEARGRALNDPQYQKHIEEKYIDELKKQQIHKVQEEALKAREERIKAEIQSTLLTQDDIRDIENSEEYKKIKEEGKRAAIKKLKESVNKEELKAMEESFKNQFKSEALSNPEVQDYRKQLEILLAKSSFYSKQVEAYKEMEDARIAYVSKDWVEQDNTVIEQRKKLMELKYQQEVFKELNKLQNQLSEARNKIANEQASAQTEATRREIDNMLNTINILSANKDTLNTSFNEINDILYNLISRLDSLEQTQETVDFRNHVDNLKNIINDRIRNFQELNRNRMDADLMEAQRALNQNNNATPTPTQMRTQNPSFFERDTIPIVDLKPKEGTNEPPPQPVPPKPNFYSDEDWDFLADGPTPKQAPQPTPEPVPPPQPDPEPAPEQAPPQPDPAPVPPPPQPDPEPAPEPAPEPVPPKKKEQPPLNIDSVHNLVNLGHRLIEMGKTLIDNKKHWVYLDTKTKELYYSPEKEPGSKIYKSGVDLGPLVVNADDRIGNDFKEWVHRNPPRKRPQQVNHTEYNSLGMNFNKTINYVNERSISSHINKKGRIYVGAKKNLKGTGIVPGYDQ